MRFDGDIIITDPCYIIKEQDMSTKPKWDDFMDRPSYAGMSREQLVDCGFFEMQKKLNEAQKEWEKLNLDDWELCEYGEDMSLIGIENCVTSDTGYGDWSCTVFEEKSNKKLGEFCADSGMVGVFLLDDILKYNPKFDYHTEKPWTTTLIKDFHGEVDIITNENGDVVVVGAGNINFKSKQTGF